MPALQDITNTLRVYLAAQYARRDELKAYAAELTALGMQVTSRWLDETYALTTKLTDVPDQDKLDIAEQDINDIFRADVFVLFTEDPTVGIPRGGRHFESGYAFGTGKPVITVGPRENVFHYVAPILNAPTWTDAKTFLQAFLALEKSGYGKRTA